MTKATTPAADAPKPDGLDTWLTTATATAKDNLGADNGSSDATVTLTTKVVKAGKQQSKTYSASVGLSQTVGELEDVPSEGSGC